MDWKRLHVLWVSISIPNTCENTKCGPKLCCLGWAGGICPGSGRERLCQNLYWDYLKILGSENPFDCNMMKYQWPYFILKNADVFWVFPLVCQEETAMAAPGSLDLLASWGPCFSPGPFNLKSGIMSLKLVLMIKFIPVVESTLHHGHWNTEWRKFLSQCQIPVIPRNFCHHFWTVFLTLQCFVFILAQGQERPNVSPAYSKLNNREELCLSSTHSRNVQRHSLLIPLASSSLIIQFPAEVSVTLSLCGLISWCFLLALWQWLFF